jgi:hypothetical protein
VDTFDEETIDARLWQDPLAVAIADGELADGKAGKKKNSEPHSVERFQRAFIEKCLGDPGRDGHMASASNEEDSTNEEVTRVLVLGVMIPGGPYVEEVERRLRSRRAVIEALGSNWEKQGYDPEKDHEIGYFCVPWLREQPTIACAVERVQANRDRDEGRGSRDSSERIGLRIKGVSTDYVVRSHSSAEPETAPLLVPYEWFGQMHTGPKKRSSIMSSCFG